MWKTSLYKNMEYGDDCVIFWVMHSYTVRLYRTEAERREKHLQFTAVRPCWVCMYSINPFTVGKYYTVNTHGKKRNKHVQYTHRFQPVVKRAVPPQLFVSLFLFSCSLFLSFFPMSLSPCVICQSLISMSWRHLYSRQTQGGMCWWLSAVAIYHLSSFCPLRR